MTHFYRSAIERILTFSILVWFGTAIAFDKTSLEKVVTKASKIIGCSFPTLSSIYTSRLVRKAHRTGPTHTTPLFSLLPSGRR